MKRNAGVRSQSERQRLAQGKTTKAEAVEPADRVEEIAVEDAPTEDAAGTRAIRLLHTPKEKGESKSNKNRMGTKTSPVQRKSDERWLVKFQSHIWQEVDKRLDALFDTLPPHVNRVDFVSGLLEDAIDNYERQRAGN